MIVYDYVKDEFLLYSTAHRITAMTRFINITDNKENLYVGDLTGNVYKMFAQDDLDDTANIEMKFESTYSIREELTPKLNRKK